MSLEESIQALTAAVVANTAAMGTAPKAAKAKKGETESAPTSTTPPTAATAPATGAAPTTSAPTSPAVVNPQLLAQTTEAVIKLANEYSREKAIGILAKYKVTRCSDLKPDQLQPVLDVALLEIAAEQAAKEAATANASLV